MIQFTQVSKAFGKQQVINNATFTVNPGERVGFVGPNGVGKSTIFELLSGNQSPDKGTISYPSSERIGYVKQQVFLGNQDVPLLDYVENAIPELDDLHAESSSWNIRLTRLATLRKRVRFRVSERFKQNSNILAAMNLRIARRPFYPVSASLSRVFRSHSPLSPADGKSARNSHAFSSHGRTSFCWTNRQTILMFLQSNGLRIFSAIFPERCCSSPMTAISSTP